MDELNTYLLTMPIDIVKYLNLSKSNLKELPDLTRFTKLVELNVQTNNIKIFDGSKLPINLKKLNCCNCNIEIIKNLPSNLQILDCVCNNIKVLDNLPHELMELDVTLNYQLYYLSVNNNLKKIKIQNRIYDTTNNLPFINNIENCENILIQGTLNIINKYRGAYEEFLNSSQHDNDKNVVFFKYNRKIINFKYLFYSLKFKKLLLRWYLKSKLLKIQDTYHPDKLIKILENNDIDDIDVLKEW